ncbi:putative ferric transport system permease protein FbpB 1 [Folsomia candida]|uniref:Putative ferric transport system permease protein FbpB 1 n=1 Tax=Folsomia candida TaxID=158441 RepID=A0A226DLN7_FOLCA|nr:putative ferric transport system permease protein FbpB 1 [Folsomia candida]
MAWNTQSRLTYGPESCSAHILFSTQLLLISTSCRSWVADGRESNLCHCYQLHAEHKYTVGWAGSLGALLVFVSLVTAHRFYLGAQATWGHPAWQVAAVLHVLCWIAQFIGHGAFEGRAPALLDNMMQAFVMAPLFVLLEVMFFFGYRKDFQKKMWIRVEAEIAKLKRATTSGRNGKK